MRYAGGRERDRYARGTGSDSGSKSSKFCVFPISSSFSVTVILTLTVSSDGRFSLVIERSLKWAGSWVWSSLGTSSCSLTGRELTGESKLVPGNQLRNTQ